MYSTTTTNTMFILLLTATFLTTNFISAGKPSYNGLHFHRHDDVDINKDGDRVVETLKREDTKSCQECREDQVLCLNNIKMTDFAEKFMCLAQYGICSKKCTGGAKRELIGNNENEILDDVVDSIFGKVAYKKKSRYQGNHQGRGKKTSPRTVADSAGNCQTECREDKELCLNNIKMTDFAQKFMCLAQYGICSKKCTGGAKRELIGNKNVNDGVDSLFTKIDADNKESRHQGNYQERSKKTSPRTVANSHLLRQVYESMPKKLLVDLLLLQDNIHNSATDKVF